MNSPAQIVWNDSFSVGEPQLDRHHQELARLINELSHHVRGPGDGQGVLNILAALHYYTGHHFEYEEQLMAESGYPGLEAHRDDHRRFAAVIAEIRRSAAQGIMRPDRLFIYLTRWWTHHVAQEDMKYKPFIAARGAA